MPDLLEIVLLLRQVETHLQLFTYYFVLVTVVMNVQMYLIYKEMRKKHD